MLGEATLPSSTAQTCPRTRLGDVPGSGSSFRERISTQLAEYASTAPPLRWEGSRGGAAAAPEMCPRATDPMSRTCRSAPPRMPTLPSCRGDSGALASAVRPFAAPPGGEELALSVRFGVLMEPSNPGDGPSAALRRAREDQEAHGRIGRSSSATSSVVTDSVADQDPEVERTGRGPGSRIAGNRAQARCR